MGPDRVLEMGKLLKMFRFLRSLSLTHAHKTTDISIISVKVCLSIKITLCSDRFETILVVLVEIKTG